MYFKIWTHPLLLWSDDVDGMSKQSKHKNDKTDDRNETSNLLKQFLECAEIEKPNEDIKQSNKMIAVIKIIEKCRELKEKLLIFSTFKTTLDIIGKFIDNSCDYYRMDGDTSAGDRHELIGKFNDPNNITPVFLISTKAGGVGLNLTAANRIIMLDCAWNPATDCEFILHIF